MDVWTDGCVCVCMCVSVRFSRGTFLFATYSTGGLTSTKRLSRCQGGRQSGAACTWPVTANGARRAPLCGSYRSRFCRDFGARVELRLKVAHSSAPRSTADCICPPLLACTLFLAFSLELVVLLSTVRLEPLECRSVAQTKSGDNSTAVLPPAKCADTLSKRLLSLTGSKNGPMFFACYS